MKKSIMVSTKKQHNCFNVDNNKKTFLNIKLLWF